MDRNAAWSPLLQAQVDADWPAALGAAVTLAEWLRRGGFPPQNVTHYPPEHLLHRRFVLIVCEQVWQATD